MGYFPEYLQRQDAAHLETALNRLANHEDLLERYRERRFTSVPPSVTSGTTTQPFASCTPEPPFWQELYALQKAHYSGRPFEMFRCQSARVQKQLDHPSDENRRRLRTLHFRRGLTLDEHADNIVRARWIEQGIWMKKWGPAWPPRPPIGPTPPRSFEHGPRPGGHWAHELPSPSNSKSSAQAASTTQDITPVMTRARSRKDTATTSENAHSIIDRDASRPHRQFLYQVSKEREWLEDEYQRKQETPPIDLYGMALQNIRKIWQEDGIWSSKWDTLPGTTWRHEVPDPDFFDHPEFRTVFPFWRQNGDDPEIEDGADSTLEQPIPFAQVVEEATPSPAWPAHHTFAPGFLAPDPFASGPITFGPFASGFVNPMGQDYLSQLSPAGLGVDDLEIAERTAGVLKSTRKRKRDHAHAGERGKVEAQPRKRSKRKTTRTRATLAGVESTSEVRNGTKNRKRDQANEPENEQSTAQVQLRRRSKRRSTQTCTTLQDAPSIGGTGRLLRTSDCRNQGAKRISKQSSECQPVRRSSRLAGKPRMNYTT